MSKTRTTLLLVVLGLFVTRPAFADPGILLLAHGGSPDWNARVTDLATQVDKTTPTEVAFGMATRATIQAAIDRLISRGVTDIVAVPLFVSSWSSVITSTEYLLGLRADAPAALANYARMNHGQPGANGTDGHGDHASPDGTRPVASRVPIRMTPALNDHAIVADILASRARSISQDPDKEAAILVAHGPNEDRDNQRWLADMGRLADRMRRTERFAAVDYLTLRDDAPKSVRDQATAELRERVQRYARDGRRVLIVPLLISFGGIDKGLRERLEGLSYAIPDAALMPDERLATWVLTVADGQ